jgi:hypothetical protein
VAAATVLLCRDRHHGAQFLLQVLREADFPGPTSYASHGDFCFPNPVPRHEPHGALGQQEPHRDDGCDWDKVLIPATRRQLSGKSEPRT